MNTHSLAVTQCMHANVTGYVLVRRTGHRAVLLYRRCTLHESGPSKGWLDWVGLGDLGPPSSSKIFFKNHLIPVQAGRQLVRSLLTLCVFVVDVMDLRTGNRNEDDS